MLQAMAEASPPKWHLAHTTWFFDNFILRATLPDYRPFDPLFHHLFNSYYETVGTFHPRHQRGLLSRPTLAEVMAYRAHVDRQILDLLQECADGREENLEFLVLLGTHHEQQHQELFFTDTLYNFSCNPAAPAVVPIGPQSERRAPPLAFIDYPGGNAKIGQARDNRAFGFDNERPRHRVYVQPFRLANRLVTNGEYLEFLNDDGYRRPEFWLADAWARVQTEIWTAPLYWQNPDGQWQSLTLAGRRALSPDSPVAHLSYYEADAYARWRGKRLATEAEWEVAATGQPIQGNFLDSGHYRPLAPKAGAGCQQLFGDLWEWTSSPYGAYPGFRPEAGSLGEYNGKFMCNQMVLRGGSCVTPRDHIRATYRNFFPPQARWQFAGVRLAEDG